MYTIGKKIKMRRSELGMTQKELGELIGADKAYISKLETDKIENLTGRTIFSYHLPFRLMYIGLRMLLLGIRSFCQLPYPRRFMNNL